MKNTEIRNILVMPAAGLGDLVMAAPVIRALRNKFGNSYIAVLAHHSRGAKEIGDCMPYLDEVIDFPLKRYSWPCVIKFFLSSYWPMFFKLRNKKFDAVVILAPNPIRTILTKMLRPAVCLIPPVLGHPTEVGLELVSQLGCSKEPLDFGFEVPNVTLDHLVPPGSPRPWIGLHPFSAMRWRDWSGYGGLISKFNQERTGTIFLLGRRDQYKKSEGVVDLVNKLSIAELIAVINSLDVLVSCDSGPMHIGFAVKTPTIALFGSVPPRLRMPLTDTSGHTAVYYGGAAGTDISIKERFKSAVNPLDDIRCEEVYERIIKTLGQ